MPTICSIPAQTSKKWHGSSGILRAGWMLRYTPYYMENIFVTESMQEKAVQLFHAFAPMLCKRPTKRIEESVKDMGGRTFILEEKLDGERMQLHKRGNEYFYCSRWASIHLFWNTRSIHDRKGKDYTYLYGKHVGTGSLTPFVDAAFDERIEEWVASFHGDSALTSVSVSSWMEKCLSGTQSLRKIYHSERSRLLRWVSNISAYLHIALIIPYIRWQQERTQS